MRVLYEEKNLFSLRIMKKICDKNLSIQKSLGYSYTVFKLKESNRFSTEDIDKVTICNFDLSRSPVYLYDRNEAATTERKYTN